MGRLSPQHRHTLLHFAMSLQILVNARTVVLPHAAHAHTLYFASLGQCAERFPATSSQSLRISVRYKVQVVYLYALQSAEVRHRLDSSTSQRSVELRIC